MKDPQTTPSSQPPISARFARDAAVVVDVSCRADRQFVEEARQQTLAVLKQLRAAAPESSAPPSK